MTEGANFAGDRKGDKGAWLAHPRVEEGFGEISRAVAEAAMQQARERTARGETYFEGGRASFEVDIKVRLRARAGRGGAQERQPVVCCICVDHGVIVCKGSCCGDW